MYNRRCSHVNFLHSTGDHIKASIEADLRTAGLRLTPESDVLCGKMRDYLLQSRGTQTVKKYSYSLNKWSKYCSNNNISALPAQPVCIALYLTALLDGGASSCTVASVVYSLKWYHGIHGLSDPTKNTYVTNILESAKRLPKTIHIEKTQ